VGMEALDLAGTFVMFLALLGPQKVLLAFARLTRTLGARTLRVVATAAAAGAQLFLNGLTVLGVLHRPHP
jgi:hypothetical protein